MPDCGIVRIIDTPQYIPKTFAFWTTTTEDYYLQRAIGDKIVIIKDTPKTLPFLSYCDATKNTIIQIDHILHRSKYQPHLQILPLRPLLSQTQSENFQLQNIPSIPVSDPRVKPFSQPPRVQIIQLAPTPPPRLQTSTSPSLYPYPNQWIKIHKIFEVASDSQARKTQMALLQVQHRFLRSPRNFRQNFRTQEAPHLVTNYLINLPHAFHIYNKQGGKENIDTLLLVKYSDTWWKAIWNEHGRHANGNDNQIRSNNTIEFIIKEEIPTGSTVTYTNFVCDHRALKSESYRVRLTVSGERLEYPYDSSWPAASISESKLLFISTTSYARRGAGFMSCDLKYFSWKPQCQENSTWGYTQNISNQTSDTNTRLKES